MLEKSKVDTQLDDAQRRVVILESTLAREELFRHQGYVTATWRLRGGRRFGPYYRLIYRKERRLRSIYLGCSEKLAGEVRALLAALQATLHDERAWRGIRRRARIALRKQKAAWGAELAKHGFELKGYEVRRYHAGWQGVMRATLHEMRAKTDPLAAPCAGLSGSATQPVRRA
jgi:hypothetical protein